MPEVVGWIALLFCAAVAALFSVASWVSIHDVRAEIILHRDETEDKQDG